MNLRRLRLFLAAAAEGSVSRAAQAQGIAQPALTRQIQLLEAEIGAPLFERGPRGLQLTDTGEFLSDALDRPLGEIEAALRGARSFAAQIRASLTIGMPPSIAGIFGASLVARLQRDLPNIALRIVEADSSQLATGLARRSIDTAILVAVVPEQRVSRTQVLSEPLMLVAPAGSDVLGGGAVALHRLEALPLILPAPPSGLRIVLDRAAEMAAIRVTAAIEVDSIELTRHLVAEGRGLAVLPWREFHAEERLAGVSIVEPALAQPVLWAVKPRLAAAARGLHRGRADRHRRMACGGRRWRLAGRLDARFLGPVDPARSLRR